MTVNYLQNDWKKKLKRLQDRNRHSQITIIITNHFDQIDNYFFRFFFMYYAIYVRRQISIGINLYHKT